MSYNASKEKMNVELYKFKNSGKVIAKETHGILLLYS